VALERSKMDVYSEIEELFTSGVSEEYLGEDVKLVEHMLQCADHARASGAPSELVIAALLHDIGHLLVDDAAAAHIAGEDAHHDEIGAQWIEARFPESVSEPVRLHVDAKRYLVSTDPLYMAKLSEASIHTLRLQGGLMDQDQIKDFFTLPGAKAAIQVRLWDDVAKIRDKATSTLDSFRIEIENLAGNR